MFFLHSVTSVPSLPSAHVVANQTPQQKEEGSLFARIANVPNNVRGTVECVRQIEVQESLSVLLLCLGLLVPLPSTPGAI
jgi:hypothetical protein|mmetsp:Transcript_58586/g.97257  ORF Transcript_58586/g.97257 Transcript_58586/m.97257 type:complete len:80 (+) Transcript_58586:1172-1411(+)